MFKLLSCETASVRGLATDPLRLALFGEGQRAFDAIFCLLEEAVCSIAIAHSILFAHLVASMDKILGPFERERRILQDRFSDLDRLIHDLIRGTA